MRQGDDRSDLPNAWSYDRLMQLLGGTVVLAARARCIAIGIGVSPDRSWPSRLSGFCLALFYLLLALLIAMTRSPAKAQAEGLLPRIAAFVGTYMPWTIVSLRQDGPHAAEPCVHRLRADRHDHDARHHPPSGRSFSLTPQARAVVQTGPYRWIRHPLYLSEEIAVVGIALRCLNPLTVIILILHFGLQVCRIRLRGRPASAHLSRIFGLRGVALEA